MDNKIRNLIKKMSITYKARQLTQLNAGIIKGYAQMEETGVSYEVNLTKQDIYGCGSALNFGLADDAIAIKERCRAKSEVEIPLLLMNDVIHGYRTIFPVPLALGCTFDTQLAEECCRVTGIESSLNGVDITFSPMVDLVRDARWGRVMESYGEDPYLNGLMGRASIRGYHKGGVGCCVKHFAAYGAAEAGREYNTTDVSEHTLREYYLKPYQECIKEKPEMVMTSFNALNGIPVNANKHLLMDILRNEWGFDGVVISDYAAVSEMVNHGYAENMRECAKIAANNGVDIEMMSTTYLSYLPELIKSGEVSEETVDKMVGRVLSLKNELNLFENIYRKTDEKQAERMCLSAEHRALARRVAEQSFVLLENNGVLPLKKSDNVAFVGPFVKEKDIIGAWCCKGRAEEAVSVAEAAEKYLGKNIVTAKGCDGGLFATDESGIGKAVKKASDADIVVACIGESSNCSGESASRVDISIPQVQIKLLQALKTAGKRVVAVIFGGRPQVLTEVKPLTDAILYVWQPGTEGGTAIINTLYGKNNPSGKLTMSFPRSVGQCPIYYNHFSTGRPKREDTLDKGLYRTSYIDELNSPLYPFGYGLSYTKLEYGRVRLSSDKMKRGETLTVTVVVKNIGKLCGSEVVQLYIRDKFASCVRPVKELKDFKKITLEADEEKEVAFAISEDILKFYAADGRFKAECGEFEVYVGSDSDCSLSGSFKLTD